MKSRSRAKRIRTLSVVREIGVAPLIAYDANEAINGGDKPIMQVQRSSDSAFADIGSKGGKTDLSSLTTFANSPTYVSIFKNQGSLGSDFDAFQNTQSFQHLIAESAGNPVFQNGILFWKTQENSVANVSGLIGAYCTGNYFFSFAGKTSNSSSDDQIFFWKRSLANNASLVPFLRTSDATFRLNQKGGGFSVSFPCSIGANLSLYNSGKESASGSFFRQDLNYQYSLSSPSAYPTNEDEVSPLLILRFSGSSHFYFFNTILTETQKKNLIRRKLKQFQKISEQNYRNLKYAEINSAANLLVNNFNTFATGWSVVGFSTPVDNVSLSTFSGNNLTSRLTIDGSNSVRSITITTGIAITSGQKYKFSIVVKSSNFTHAEFFLSGTPANLVGSFDFDFANGVINSSSGFFDKIQIVGLTNGWLKLEIQTLAASGSGTLQVGLRNIRKTLANPTTPYTGNGTDVLYLLNAYGRIN